MIYFFGDDRVPVWAFYTRLYVPRDLESEAERARSMAEAFGPTEELHKALANFADQALALAWEIRKRMAEARADEARSTRDKREDWPERYQRYQGPQDDIAPGATAVTD